MISFLLYVVRVCVFLLSIMRLYPFLTLKSNHKSYFLRYYLGKGATSPKETGMHPRPFSFAFISGRALRNEKAPAIHHCPKVRSQRDDSEVASDTRQRLSQERTGEWQQPAKESSLPKGMGTGEGGWQGGGAGRADSVCSHPEPHKARLA